MAEERTRRSTATIDSTAGPATRTDSGLGTADALQRQHAAALAQPWRFGAAWTNWPGNSTMLAVGRAIFGGYFLYNGINHFTSREMLSQYARSKNVPAADLAVPASGAMLALGGASVLAGVQPKIGASMIAAFLLGVSPQMHDFWRMEDQQQRMAEFVNFTKNMALVGAACLVAALPEPWPMSVPVPAQH
jgi:putative oxidoreductase